MAWASPKLFAILKNSEEGKNLLEKAGDMDQDTFNREVEQLFGKGGKGEGQASDYIKAKAEDEKEQREAEQAFVAEKENNLQQANEKLAQRNTPNAKPQETDLAKEWEAFKANPDISKEWDDAHFNQVMDYADSLGKDTNKEILQNPNVDHIDDIDDDKKTVFNKDGSKQDIAKDTEDWESDEDKIFNRNDISIEEKNKLNADRQSNLINKDNNANSYKELIGKKTESDEEYENKYKTLDAIQSEKAKLNDEEWNKEVDEAFNLDKLYEQAGGDEDKMTDMYRDLEYIYNTGIDNSDIQGVIEAYMEKKTGKDIVTRYGEKLGKIKGDKAKIGKIEKNTPEVLEREKQIDQQELEDAKNAAKEEEIYGQIGNGNNKQERKLSKEQWQKTFNNLSRKPSDTYELEEAGTYIDKITPNDVNDVIQVSDEEFNDLIKNPLHDNEIIAEGKEKGLIAIRSEHGNQVLLVDPQGYDYVRYGALIPAEKFISDDNNNNDIKNSVFQQATKAVNDRKALDEKNKNDPNIITFEKLSLKDNKALSKEIGNEVYFDGHDLVDSETGQTILNIEAGMPKDELVKQAKAYFGDSTNERVQNGHKWHTSGTKVTTKNGTVFKIGQKFDGEEIEDFDPSTNSVIIGGRDYDIEDFERMYGKPQESESAKQDRIYGNVGKERTISIDERKRELEKLITPDVVKRTMKQTGLDEKRARELINSFAKIFGGNKK